MLLLGRGKARLVTAGHDAAKETIPRCDRGRLLRGSSMLRRARHTLLRATFASRFELMSKHADFFLVPRNKISESNNIKQAVSKPTFASVSYASVPSHILSLEPAAFR